MLNNEIPGILRHVFKNNSIASSPPAEAPMPTMGKSRVRS
jgi:hypothetical protein